MATKKTVAKRAAKTKAKAIAVLVTTEHRGVFFGYATTDKPAGNDKSITLAKARNCIYWESSLHGFLGLATSGPNSKCKVGPAAPSSTFTNVTSVTTVTDEAAAAWERAPWA